MAVSEDPAAGGVDKNQMLLPFQRTKVADCPQQRPRRLAIDLVSLSDGPALEQVAERQPIDVFLQPGDAAIILDPNVALPQIFVRGTQGVLTSRFHLDPFAEAIDGRARDCSEHN